MQKEFRNKQSDQGRSMVEMLGSMAIIGVLSVGAIGGYSYAMNKHRTNELIYEATKRAQWVGTQLEMNNPNPSLNTFGTDSFGGGTFGAVTILDNNQFGIAVTGLKEAVCHNILNSIGDNTVIREMRDVNCSGNNGTATLVFNRDLSTSDSEITPDEPEVSGEVSEQASVATEATATQDPDEVHCSGNGSWNGSSCYCDNGWQGDNCSEEEPEETEDHTCSGNGTWIIDTGTNGRFCSCNSGWGGSDCSIENACSGHGTWYGYLNNGAGGCSCNSGWGGSDCSEDHTNDCSGHGTWAYYLNNGAGGCWCNTGWVGSDCSEDHTCSGHGTWVSWVNNGAGGCSCNSGWGGSDCSEDHRHDCSGHGYWDQWSGCLCDSNWYGPKCACYSSGGNSGCSAEFRTYCSNHGTWRDGTCYCDSGYGGVNCSVENPCASGVWIPDTSKPNGGFCEGD